MYTKFVKKGLKICLCVSGGVDSMVMLYRFLELKKDIDFNLSVLNVDHNIRKESKSDSDFVLEQCNCLGVECKSVFIDCLPFCKENKISIESGARLLRYKVFDEESEKVDFMCLAHHLNDQAETILMHLLRGSGSKGAEGMKLVNGKYVRPLLDTTKEEILTFAQKNSIPFVEDKTNSENEYKRNYIRNVTFPMLRLQYPSCDTALVKFGEAISQDNALLNTLVNMDGIAENENGISVPFQLFAQPLPLVKRMLFNVFNMCGVFFDIEKKHIDMIVDFQKNCVSGKMLNLPFDICVIKSYSELIFAKTTNAIKKNTVVPFKTGSTILDDTLLTVNQEGKGLKFDLQKLPPNCVFRRRQDGDIFKKFGSGTKKLKEYLIDKKIPFFKRDDLVLVACENEVYLIVGVEISDKIKVDESAKQIFYISRGDIENEDTRGY